VRQTINTECTEPDHPRSLSRTLAEAGVCLAAKI
jgi:hypothetical protein